MVERIVASLAAREAISVKETLESFEAFSRMRRRMRAPRMADLCCGHGLTGLLFAASEREVKEVILLDRAKPPKADLIVEAVVEAAPWVEEKVRWIEDDVSRAAEHLEPDTSIIAVHACGVFTDRVIDAALAVGGNVAVMPCCYAQTAAAVPAALREALGAELATDVHRTYRLEAAGYRVEWAKIPAAITPKNRILVGLVRNRSSSSRPVSAGRKAVVGVDRASTT